ncbi:carbohydrate ABC transporter permease [Microbacterium pseudoresistens]|uniref:Raffinose/stachyose/melibiose transport system permease protein n=1 Tax=Microbacterium pseudoresistens TaxID=640634 RepID=A0A7Y9EUX3_9MICO|nr:carbohydrate ABC transporter permease [Microbacterium pseudoresistens]NYD54405.1 raffinose/stachyose/melibiose transport system permease protein [Microbacterium pseudoresistens]
MGLPTRLTFDNFANTIEQLHYGRSVLNTVLILVGTSVLVVVFGSLASYPLARISRRWTGWAYRLFILGMSLPVFVTLAPLYLLMRDLGLLNSLFGVVLIYTATYLPITIFFYTSFLRQVPAELEEAAAIDGAGFFRMFWQIVLPLLRPVTGTLLVYIALHVWNDLVIPLVFLNEPETRTVMVNAYALVNPNTVEPTMLFPAAVLGVLPLLIVFLVLQKQVVAGMTAGAVKG